MRNEYLYTGRRLDPETGLQLNRNRFYHAALGRWVKQDPVGYRDSINLYEYVGSDPASWVDPSGEGKVGFLIKCAKGAWRRVSKNRARRALKDKQDVLVQGKGAAKDAKKLGKENFGNKNTRHDGHNGGRPHWQHKNGGRGHVFYETISSLTAVSIFGDNFFGNEIDFVNPISDIKDIIDLGSDVIGTE